MRATKLEELVFAGTPTKKGAPFAEVTAIFDNSDGVIPVELSEVAITRRLDADGDSKFYINRVSCRLRDVHELLMGSGIGPGSFSVLGGKEVDQVLSTDPKDRRAMLEETAGVNRYKFRKREAQRKLEKTAQNLTRLQDILGELADQLEESTKQLGRYQQYKAAQIELQGLETQLALNDWVQLNLNLAKYQDSTARAETALKAAQARAAGLSGQAEQLNLAKSTLEGARDGCNQELSCLREQIGISKARYDSIFQRANMLEQGAASALSRFEHSQKRLEDSHRELATMEQLLPQAEVHAQVAAEAVAGVKAALAGLARPGQGPHGELRTRLGNLEREHQTLVGKREALLARLENDRARRGELMDQLAAAKLELEQMGDESRAETDPAELLQRLHANVEKSKQEKLGFDRQLEELRQTRRKLEGERRPLVGRLAEIEAILEDRSGLPPAVRSVMSWKVAGTVGLIGELIQVPPGLEQAFEAAMGGHIYDVVTRDRKAAAQMIDRLKQDRLGRATFWPLDLQRQPPPPPQLPDKRGVVGVALDLLGYPPEIAEVLAEIVGRTVIMEDMPLALALYDRCRGRRPHLVTKQGEYLNPNGALTGGSLRQNQTGLLGRKKVLEEARAAVQAHEKKLTELNAQEEKLQLARQNAEAAANEAQEEFRELRRELADQEADLRRRTGDRDRSAKLVNRLQGELKQIDERAQQSEDGQAQHTKRLEEIVRERTDVEEKLLLFQAEEARLQAERELAQRRLMEAELEYQSRSRQLQELQREQQRLSTRQSELQQELANSQSERENSLSARQALEIEGKDLEVEMERLKALLVQSNQALEGVRQQLAELEQNHRESNAQWQAADADQRRAGERWHHQQLELAKVQAHVEEALERLGARPDPGQLPGKPVTAEELTQIRSKATKLRNFLEKFGGVNLGAEEDHERLQSRHQELNTQVTDLEDGAESLKQIIREMDDVTVVQFREAFHKVNETFGRIFADLFNGGTARLELTHPDDMLESGVEIVACPPGKRLQNLTLLSSGERALSAMAFLLSLLSCKPSPIVILDELDAPLDDSNVERVASRLLEFSSSSQFLVITHNRKTMEFADRLYGVTMEEPGLSRVVSVRLTKDGEMVPQSELQAAHSRN
jgi:chromosome segregation protein